MHSSCCSCSQQWCKLCCSCFWKFFIIDFARIFTTLSSPNGGYQIFCHQYRNYQNSLYLQLVNTKVNNQNSTEIWALLLYLVNLVPLSKRQPVHPYHQKKTTLLISRRGIWFTEFTKICFENKFSLGWYKILNDTCKFLTG